MSIKLKTFLIVFFSIAILAGYVPAQDKNTVALQNLIKQMAHAQAGYDAATLAMITTGDYIEISPVGEFDPREKMLGFYKPELKPKNMEVKSEADEFSVRTYGKTAVVIARLTYLMTMESKPLPPRSMRVTYVCRKEKGMWKVASVQYTSIRPPGSVLQK